MPLCRFTSQKSQLKVYYVCTRFNRFPSFVVKVFCWKKKKTEVHRNAAADIMKMNMIRCASMQQTCTDCLNPLLFFLFSCFPFGLSSFLLCPSSGCVVFTGGGDQRMEGGKLQYDATHLSTSYSFLHKQIICMHAGDIEAMFVHICAGELLCVYIKYIVTNILTYMLIILQRLYLLFPCFVPFSSHLLYSTFFHSSVWSKKKCEN